MSYRRLLFEFNFDPDERSSQTTLAQKSVLSRVGPRQALVMESLSLTASQSYAY